MTEAELRERLQSAQLDLDPHSEQRAWQIVRNAYDPHPAARSRPRRRPRRAILAVACCALAAAIALGTISAPRQAFARWFRDAFGLSAQPHTVRVLGGLPGGGRLLVNTANGPWLVNADGSRHYLGSYAGAAFSPHSLYVVAWRGTELAALNLAGARQWVITAPGPITAARWSPDGYRIAFLAHDSLRVAAGDSSGEHALSDAAAPVPPAWQPHTGSVHRVTFVRRDGSVEQIDTDSGALVWRVRPPAPARQLLWSPDGRRLLVVGADELTEYSASGQQITTISPSPRARIGAAAFISATQFVLISHPVGGDTDSIQLRQLGSTAPPVILYTGIERLAGLAASPAHQWLLATSPTADQWIFIHIGTPPKLLATSAITTKFQRAETTVTSFPQLDGWQR
jgi:hypothetical protein